MILTDARSGQPGGGPASFAARLLGMHALGDGAGVVVRAFHPRAVEVEAIPVHEKNKPRIKLKQVRPGLFEGTPPRKPRRFMPTI